MRFVIEEVSDGDESFNRLIDTVTGKWIFHDCMEPEDATLTRDLNPLVTVLNALAEELTLLDPDDG